jgi:hypothetical protein
LLGREVSVIKDGVMQAGKYNINFDASSLRSGVYFYKITTNEFTDTKKMILLK